MENQSGTNVLVEPTNPRDMRGKVKLSKAELVNSLVNIVGVHRVIHEPDYLRVYECDGYVARNGLPSAVVFPETTQEVAEIVRLLAKHQVPFLPRGAGTGLSGGATPLNGEVILNFARMNKLISVDLDNLRAVVQPGYINLTLSKEIDKDGFFYAPDPSSQSSSTIGGNVAENSGGAHCLKYGVTTNHVVAATVVLPTGEIAHIGTPFGDAVGYDLMGLFVGAEGTLGIVTEITVRIMKKPEAVKTVQAMYDSIAQASDTVSDIIRAGILPAAIEFMDKLAIQAVEKSSYHVGYPEDIEAILIIEVDGLTAGLEETTDKILDICRRHEVRTVKMATNANERALWWGNRKMAFGAMGQISPDYLVQDGSVPRTRLTEALARIQAMSRDAGLRIANVFHAGDGNLHPLILYDSANPEETERAIQTASKILKVCADLGGTITGEHGVGLEKLEEMRYVFNKTELEAQLALRKVFDPQNLCNAGKLIPLP